MIDGPRLISCDRLLRGRREDHRLLPVPSATSSDCGENTPPRSGTSVPLTKGDYPGLDRRGMSLYWQLA